jgi:hypothetical protein
LARHRNGNCTDGTAYVRLRVSITEDKDYIGAMLAPGLSSQAIEFVVHRLRGGAAPGRKPAAIAIARAYVRARR